jgi:hypothetical protein
MHPHSREAYYDLFIEALTLKKIVKLRSDKVAVLNTINHINPQKPLEGIYGTFSKYTFVDPQGDWYNTLKDQNATSEDINMIRIPDHLKYNLSKFHFVFFPKGHRLVVEAYHLLKSISPNTVQLFFKELLNSEELQEKFPEIEVIIEQSRQKLNEIFKLPILSSLEIYITRPNADDGQEDEEEVMRRMEAQNVGTLYIQNKSLKGQSIIPDRETNQYARVAISNGYVKASGKKENLESVNESTEDHPFTDSYRYNQNTESFIDTFIVKAREILNLFL